MAVGRGEVGQGVSEGSGPGGADGVVVWWCKIWTRWCVELRGLGHGQGLLIWCPWVAAGCLHDAGCSLSEGAGLTGTVGEVAAAGGQCPMWLLLLLSTWQPSWAAGQGCRVSPELEC